MDKKFVSEAERKNIENHVRAYELFSNHDPAMFDLFDENIVEKQEPDPIVGKAALAEFNRAFWAGFSDLRVDLDCAYGAGDYTFVAGRLRGTNDGDFPMMGLSKTGKAIDIGFVEVVHWKNGKAVLSVPLMDNEEMLRQLGLSH